MKRINYSTFLLVVVLLILPLEARAETGARNIIEEVLVTARRREESVQDVPIPVSNFSGEQLISRVSEDMRDLSRIIPNLSFQESVANKNSASVFLRGIGQTNWIPTQDPKIGIYVDGVYLGRPQGAIFDLMDIERVEVLRGPQGTLFGRNTTAGLIHVISNKPQEELDWAMTAGAGNDDILHFEGMLNIPVTEDLAMRLAFQHRESEGFVENTGTGQDWNDENAQNLRFSVLWAPNDKFDALFIADVQRVREKSGLGSCEWAQPDNGALATSLLPSVAFIFGVYDEIRDTCNATQPYKSSENDPADSDVDGWGVSLNMTIDLNFAELTSITSYREIEDFNGSWGFASDTVGSASFLEVLGVRDNRGDQWSQELRLAGSAFEDRLEWVVGAHVFEENAANYLEVPLFRGVEAPDCAVWPVFCLPSGIPGFSTLGDFALAIQFGGSSVRTIEAKNASWAVFGEGTFALTEDLSLTLGARFSEDDREFVRTEILSAGIPDPRLICPDGGLPEGGTTCEVSKKFNELTPRAILSYKINEDVMIYGGWSEGYSSGGFNQDVRMRAYKPESSGNWEAGLKSTWLDRRLLLNLTGFYNTYKEQQLTVSRLVDGNPTADLINAQETVLYGLEGEASLLFGDGWSVQASFGWLDGEYEEFTVADNITGPPPDFEESILIRDLSGMEAIDGAPYTYSISVERIAVFGNGGSYFANLGWSFRGRTYGTIETLPTSRQGKYGLMDARFTYNFPGGSTSLSLWGSNLLDREYFSSAHDFSSGPSPTGTVSKHWGEPRRFGLDLSYRMGQ